MTFLRRTFQARSVRCRAVESLRVPLVRFRTGSGFADGFAITTGPPHAQREGAGRRSGEVRRARRQSGGRMPRVQAAEGRYHPGCDSGEVSAADIGFRLAVEVSTPVWAVARPLGIRVRGSVTRSAGSTTGGGRESPIRRAPVAATIGDNPGIGLGNIGTPTGLGPAEPVGHEELDRPEEGESEEDEPDDLKEGVPDPAHGVGPTPVVLRGDDGRVTFRQRGAQASRWNASRNSNPSRTPCSQTVRLG